MIGVDLQEAVQAAVSKGSVLLPPTTPALPEEVAWSMVYAEGGALALVLAIAVTVLWKLISRIHAETRALNADLVVAQAAAVKQLAEGVAKVEAAVKLSDVHNTSALARLTESLAAVVVRLDKHEARLERHSDRISVIEVEAKIEERARRPKTHPGTA